jgi:hypothetical protein
MGDREETEGHAPHAAVSHVGKARREICLQLPIDLCLIRDMEYLSL